MEPVRASSRVEPGQNHRNAIWRPMQVAMLMRGDACRDDEAPTAPFGEAVLLERREGTVYLRAGR